MAKPSTRSTRNNSTDDLTVDQKLDLLLSNVADIKNTNVRFSEDIKNIKDDLQQLKSDINESLDLCFKKIEESNKIVEDSVMRIGKSEQVIENLQSENISLKKMLQECQRTLQSAEQYSRGNCIEVHGVPEVKGEVILDVVKRVARVLNYELKEDMIDAVHRLSKNVNNPQAPRGIIIKFCRRLDMEQLRSRTRVKNGFLATELGFQSENKIFLNLSLTKHTRVLWSEVRAFKHRRNFKFAWITSAGKVFLRKEEGSPAILITDISELERIK